METSVLIVRNQTLCLMTYYKNLKTFIDMGIVIENFMKTKKGQVDK